MQDDPPKGRDKGSLAERIVGRMAQGQKPAAEARHEVLSAGAGRAAEPAALYEAPPVAAPPQAAGPQDTDDGGININFNRLQTAGFITPNSPRSAATEEFRTIKRQLLKTAFTDGRKRRSDNSNIIMVTSSVPAEGKTFVSLNLAMSFSIERDLYVLLVDGDSHRHSLSDLLGVPQGRAGLVDLMVDRDLQMRDVIQRTNIPNFTFITSGRPHPHGAELLASKDNAAMMLDLASRYPDRIIVIDTPPLMASTEAAVLAAHVGHTVLVVEKDRTSKRTLQRSLAMLEGCANVSCVLNMDTGEQPFSEYAYGY